MAMLMEINGGADYIDDDDDVNWIAHTIGRASDSRTRVFI